MMTFIIGAMILGLLPAFIGQSKGGSFGAWWLFGFLLFPIALIAAIFHSPERCPLCREAVRADAIVCKHCRHPLPEKHHPQWIWNRTENDKQLPRKNTFAVEPLSRPLKITMLIFASALIALIVVSRFF